MSLRRSNERPGVFDFMIPGQAIRYWSAEARQLNNERRILRKLLSEAAECIQSSAHGHTPNWHRLMEGIERYEDDYSPLEDEN
jgi:hypothetical protein